MTHRNWLEQLLRYLVFVPLAVAAAMLRQHRRDEKERRFKEVQAKGL